MEPTYNSKLLCMRLYVHLYTNQSTPRLAKSRKRMRPSGTRADSPTLSFLSTDRTDLSKYGLVEQIHTPCDHQGDPRCLSLLSWYLLLNQVIEFLNLLQETIFNGEVAHWVCSITGLDIKREGESTRTLVNTGLYAAWSTRQYACCSLQYLTKKKKNTVCLFHSGPQIQIHEWKCINPKLPLCWFHSSDEFLYMCCTTYWYEWTPRTQEDDAYLLQYGKLLGAPCVHTWIINVPHSPILHSP